MLPGRLEFFGGRHPHGQALCPEVVPLAVRCALEVGGSSEGSATVQASSPGARPKPVALGCWVGWGALHLRDLEEAGSG